MTPGAIADFTLVNPLKVPDTEVGEGGERYGRSDDVTARQLWSGPALQTYHNCCTCTII